MTLIRFPVVEYRPASRDVPVAADTLIPSGNLVAVDKGGHAVPATDTTDLTIAGVAFGLGRAFPRKNGDADNRGNKAGIVAVNVRTGLFRFLNSSAAPVAASDVGKTVFVEDSRTVTRATGKGVVAGSVVCLVGAVYVWLFIGPASSLPGSPFFGDR